MSSVCKEIGLSNSVSTGWKKRGTIPKNEVLIQLSGYLGVPVDFFFAENVKASLEEMEANEIRNDEWVATQEKTANQSVSGLDESLVALLQQVPEDKIQRVKDFVAGLLNS